MKIPQAKPTKWGGSSKLLPSRKGLNTLNKTNRTINDYAKQVPTNPATDNPLLLDLMQKP